MSEGGSLRSFARRWDIGVRVQLAAVVPAALLTGVLAWYFTAARIGELETELAERGLAIVRQLAPASEFGVFSGNEDILRQLAESAAREAGVEGVAIVDREGRILAASGVRVDPRLEAPSEATLHIATPRARVFAAPIGQLQTTIDPLFDPRRPQGSVERLRLGTVVVQISTEQLTQRRASLIRGAAVIGLFGLALAVGLAQLLARGVTGPVMRLAQTVARIGRGDFTARAPGDAAGRLGVLERGVNDMAASLDDARTHLEERIWQATAEIQKAKNRAEEANRTKTQFLAAASHDLRQPLQALGLLISSLRMRVKEPQTATVVGRVENALAGLEAVLEGLLDISRLDAGAVAPHVESFPLARILDRVGETYAAQAAAKGLRVRVVPTGMWCTSDPVLLERIVANFVSNALRYTASGGVVIGARPRAGAVSIEVWDSGSGIPADKLREIFKEFFQLDAGRQRDQGLGLGLAIVERLCRLLDHPVQVRSRPGRGSVFGVIVPRARAAGDPDAGAPPEPLDSLAGLTVLVIDDDIEVLEALETFLGDAGASVIAVVSLVEAKRRLHTSGARPDVVVTDYRLGGEGDGIEAIAALESELGKLPAVILTGESDPAILQAIASTGLALAAKPVRPEQLKAMISRAARR